MLQTGTYIENLARFLHCMSCRNRLAEVHKHLFHEVWNAARLEQRLGTLHPSAAYNAMAALSQVTQIVLWTCPLTRFWRDCDASCLRSLQGQPTISNAAYIFF